MYVICLLSVYNCIYKAEKSKRFLFDHTKEAKCCPLGGGRREDVMNYMKYFVHSVGEGGGVL